MKLSLKTKAILTILIVIVLDQVLKIWIKTNMMLGEEFVIFDNWAKIHFTENYGMAFGFEFGGAWGKILLNLLRFVAIFVIFVYLYKLIKKHANFGFVISIALICAGAIGNTIDSIFYGVIFNTSEYSVAQIFPADGGYSSLFHGRVVDMFYFPMFEGYYSNWFPFFANEKFVFFQPIFNLADAAITLGVFIIIIFHRKYFKKENDDNRDEYK